MTRKTRSQVIILIIEHGFMSKVENGVLKRYLKYLPSDKFKTLRIFLVDKVQNAFRENIPKSIFEKFRPEEREKLVFFSIVWTVGLTERMDFLIPYLLSGVVWCGGGRRVSWDDVQVEMNEQVFTRVKNQSHPMVFSSNPATSTWKGTGIWNEVHDRLPGQIKFKILLLYLPSRLCIRNLQPIFKT